MQPVSKQQKDVFRDSLLRYVAFTSDVGEALKPFIARRLYLASYAVVALYGLADTADKGRRAYLQHQDAKPRVPQLASAPLANAAIAAAALAGPAAATAATSRVKGQPLASAFALPRSATSCAACALPTAFYLAPSSATEPRATAATASVASAVAETAVWHAAASLAIPAAMINRTVWATTQLLSKGAWAARLHPRVRQLAPSAAGLALIPLLVPHVDEAVTAWMEQHVHPVLAVKGPTGNGAASDAVHQPQACPVQYIEPTSVQQFLSGFCSA
ncbi:hypothetical protein D9Q98_006826 [Chlorella vulgaris]|uniref:Mitochondrial fission process protein 1 n=1 Tax=Chlorella vulgaris TaxID=3077 RepID=A0A9D4TIW8_CHLVU|nr:hypothetical protein D9Q98_006826 [Chlorella vulgaris]